MKARILKLFEVRMVNNQQIVPTVVLAQSFEEAIFKLQGLWRKSGLRPIGEFR